MKKLTKAELRKQIEEYLKILYRKSVTEATNQQIYQALSYALKDMII